MTLTKPNQELRRDLQGIASDLKWSAVELAQIAGRLNAAGNDADAAEVRRLCGILRNGEDLLSALSDQVLDGAITRQNTWEEWADG